MKSRHTPDLRAIARRAMLDAGLDPDFPADAEREVQAAESAGERVEPGIYLPGNFGVRSEVDVYVSDGDIEVTGQPVQTELVAILKEK